jgi:hypothetical protein
VTAPTSILVPIVGGGDRVQAIKNEMLIKPRLDAAIDTFHASQPSDIPEPEISEESIDLDLQTGDSALLGGEMRIRSPWSDT